MMSRIRKRAYISCALIILALAWLAYYTQQQSQKLSVEFDELHSFTDFGKNSKPQTPTFNPPVTPINPEPTPGTSDTSEIKTPAPPPQPAQKFKNIFVDINEFQATVPNLTASAGYQINLYVKSIKPTGSSGLLVTVPGQASVLIQPGITKKISFIASSDISIGVADESNPTKLLHSISVDVK